METIVLRQKERRKHARHGFETLSDIIRREDHIIPQRSDVRLSLTLHGANLLREEMNEGAR